MPASQLRLQIIADPHEVRLVSELRSHLNRPGWPDVDVRVSESTVSCVAQTWEPILRVRIEEALEQMLGTFWRELVQWL